MANPTVEIREGRVSVDLTTDQLERLGWQNDQQLEVSQSGDSLTLRPQLTQEQFITSRAFRHLALKVGINVGADRPHLAGGRFEVPVYRGHDRHFLGTLSFTPDGELIPEASTPDAQMRTLADAD
jgi:hypothetical protein